MIRPTLCLRTAVLLGLSAGGSLAHAQQSFVGSSSGTVSLEAPEPRAAAPAPAPVPYTHPFAVPSSFHIAPSVVQSTVPEKLSYYLSSAVSVRNFAEAFLITGVPNITTAPTQPMAPADMDDPVAAQAYQDAMTTYGDQMDTWRRVNEATLRYDAARFETGFATAETRQLLSNLVLPLALHQEGRYIPAPVDATLGERLWNAASSIVVTRNDAGFRVPNYSKLGGTVGAALLGRSLYADALNAPELNSGRFVMHYVGYSLLGDLATNTAHELVRAAIAPDLTMYQLHGYAHDDAYYPLSLGGKVMLWARSAYSLRNFVEAGLLSGIPEVPTEPVEPEAGNILTWQQAQNYNQAYETWGMQELAWKDSLENQLRYRERAFIGGFSESETQELLGNLVLPIALDMDPRYLPLGPGHGAGQRFAHALRGLVVTHTDSGNQMVNVPLLGSTVGAAFAAQKLYYPGLGAVNLESGSVLAKTISLNLVADAVGNLYDEFLSRRRF